MMPASSCAGRAAQLHCGLHCNTLVGSPPYHLDAEWHKRSASVRDSVHAPLRSSAAFIGPAQAEKLQPKVWQLESTFGCRYSANFGNATAEVQALVEFLQSVYNVWQKPVWLTELCQVNFGATTSLTRFPSYDQQLAFMSAAIPALDTLPFLERYAWYALFPDQLFSNNTAALYDDSGNPTPTGTLYATL